MGITEALAKNLERFRKQKSLSQESLAKLIGVSRQTIWSYEKGEGSVSLETISKLASALGVDELELIIPEELVLAGQARIESLLDLSVKTGVETGIRKIVAKYRPDKLEKLDKLLVQHGSVIDLSPSITDKPSHAGLLRYLADNMEAQENRLRELEQQVPPDPRLSDIIAKLSALDDEELAFFRGILEQQEKAKREIEAESSKGQAKKREKA